MIHNTLPVAAQGAADLNGLRPHAAGPKNYQGIVGNRKKQEEIARSNRATRDKTTHRATREKTTNYQGTVGTIKNCQGIVGNRKKSLAAILQEK